MKRRRGRVSNFAAGAIAIVLITVGTFLGFTKSIPFLQHYEIKAAFQNANGIKSSSPVRIAGVEVGRVTKVEPIKKGGQAALVTMRIKEEGRPIKADARMKIRPRIFLEGNFFVDVNPGTPTAAELDDNQVIPIQQTAVPVQLDQVLQDLPAETREDLRGTFAELFRAYSDGAGSAFNRSLAFQPDAYRFSAVVNDALQGRQPDDLSSILRDVGTVASALDANPQQLKSLITDFNTFAGALASEQGALQAAVRELPQTLAAAGPALDALNGAFPEVRTLAREALPGVRSTPATLDSLQPLVEQLRPLVSEDELQGLAADLRATTPSLARLARDTVPLLQESRQLSSCANEVLNPWSKDTVKDAAFPASGQVFQEFGKVLPALAGESRSFDANGQWFKVLGTGGVETFNLGRGILGTSANPVLGANPPKSKRPPLKPEVPCETQQTPDLESRAASGPQQMENDPNSAKAKERDAKARDVSIEIMQRKLSDALGDKAPKISDENATLSDIKSLTSELRP